MKKGVKITIIIASSLLVIGAAIFLLTRKWGKWEFTDNHWVDGKLGFIGSVRPDGIDIGDNVIIKQDPGAKFSLYDGKTEIIDMFVDGGRYVVVVSKPRLGDTPANPGIIKF